MEYEMDRNLRTPYGPLNAATGTGGYAPAMNAGPDRRCQLRGEKRVSQFSRRAMVSKSKARSAPSQTFRAKAEQLAGDDVAGMSADLQYLDAGVVQRLFHELRVHQIELEMQNEELKRAQLELEESRAMYAGLYDFAPTGYFTLDEQGRIVEANRTFLSMLGVRRDEVIKKRFHHFILPEDQDVYFLYQKRTGEAGKTLLCELRVLRKDAPPLWVQIQSRVEGNVISPQLRREAMIDVSQRKEDELLRASIESIARHDLRSPMSGIVGGLDMLLKDDNLSPRQREWLMMLSASAARLLDGIICAIDADKFKHGRWRDEAEDVDAAETLDYLAREIGLVSRHTNKRLIVLQHGATPSPGEPCRFKGHPVLFRTAVRNLLDNALEASPPQEPVIADIACGDGGLRLEISNRGAVPPEVREVFFEKYSTSGKKYGTGLGTFSAKMMIEAMGGSITMWTSDEADKTVVSVRIPLTGPAGPAEAEHPVPA